MSRKVLVVLQDDLNGGEPAQTVTFGLDNKTYEIDLTAENAQLLRESLAAWIAAARPAQSSSRSWLRRSSNTAEIRRWARENGIPVRERGRISVDLRSRYEAAH